MKLKHIGVSPTNNEVERSLWSYVLLWKGSASWPPTQPAKNRTGPLKYSCPIESIRHTYSLSFTGFTAQGWLLKMCYQLHTDRFAPIGLANAK